MNAAALVSVALWALQMSDDEQPYWFVAIAVGVAVAATLGVRELVARRSRARRVAAAPIPVSVPFGSNSGAHSLRRKSYSIERAAGKLRKLQDAISELDAGGMTSEAHMRAYGLCEKYLLETDEAIRAAEMSADVRVALRAGQERVRGWQKRHLLEWARLETQKLTQEALRRERFSDKIETARRSLEVIDEALRRYPNEPELLASADVVRDMVASLRVSHWVEMAERAAFRGKYARAIARYEDALFYLSRAEMTEAARNATAQRLRKEIESMSEMREQALRTKPLQTRQMKPRRKTSRARIEPTPTTVVDDK